jgi:hypothetical protein
MVVALMHGGTAAQIGQRESRLPIAAVCRTDEREERIVLRNREQLPGAECPTQRRVVAPEHPDFTYEGVCHINLLPDVFGSEQA